MIVLAQTCGCLEPALRIPPYLQEPQEESKLQTLKIGDSHLEYLNAQIPAEAACVLQPLCRHRLPVGQRPRWKL